MPDVRWAVAKVRGAVASEAKGDRSKGEQCAEDETGEKDAFHGAVWLVVYSSSDGVSTEDTDIRRNKLRLRNVFRVGGAAPPAASRCSARASLRAPSRGDPPLGCRH